MHYAPNQAETARNSHIVFLIVVECIPFFFFLILLRAQKFEWFVSFNCSLFTLSDPGSSPADGKRRNFQEFSTPGREDKALLEEGKMGAFCNENLQETSPRKSTNQRPHSHW